MFNDHGRALRQFLALVHRLDRRSPGLTLSSERGHGKDLGMERLWNKVATQPRRDKPVAPNHTWKVQISQQREAREVEGMDT